MTKASPIPNSGTHGNDSHEHGTSIKPAKEPVEDKRKIAREEHTNHFTNREGHAEKKQQ